MNPHGGQQIGISPIAIDISSGEMYIVSKAVIKLNTNFILSAKWHAARSAEMRGLVRGREKGMSRVFWRRMLKFARRMCKSTSPFFFSFFLSLGVSLNLWANNLASFNWGTIKCSVHCRSRIKGMKTHRENTS